MVQEEFGGRKRGPHSSSAELKLVFPLIIEGRPSKTYSWEVLREVVIIKAAPNAHAEIVWDPRKFINDGEGRVPLRSLKEKKISPEDLKKIQDWYLVFSEPSSHLIKLEKSNIKNLSRGQVNSYDRVYAACENVDDVKLPNGTPLGKAVVRARTKLREIYPEHFKTDGSNNKSSGHN
ncbi:MAG: hypothetical protein ACXVB1_10165 [Pseudobdellovibrionaceae bacterium]